MTDEQVMAFLTSQGNLSVEEKKLAQRQALTNALRQQAGSPATSSHWTAQAAKALQGIGAGYGTLQERKAMDQYGTNVNKSLGGLADMFLKKKPLTPDEDPSLAYSGQGAMPSGGSALSGFEDDY